MLDTLDLHNIQNVHVFLSSFWDLRGFHSTIEHEHLGVADFIVPHFFEAPILVQKARSIKKSFKCNYHKSV